MFDRHGPQMPSREADFVLKMVAGVCSVPWQKGRRLKISKTDRSYFENWVESATLSTYFFFVGFEQRCLGEQASGLASSLCSLEPWGTLPPFSSDYNRDSQCIYARFRSAAKRA
ncbi:hypothetical protein Mp_6g18100 [Marchantia polymorpha subsp. ruderalis]|uniref:Uncharacterized protein n=2 Tax=Marchantia polymorpha TaxID=3197 RepID=A0AAF6BT94_MARPO|nr:hypothetical protein MARPO_0038s0020 [Marchantia polymorpha]BBN15228.1 hypothetical protein Mp_6g18100 [Marchantia polymorpha subsp. ruderalis]|eukprot:PTQ40661.1 hypothetical protein MARPO_0038s0020 [Marchantia polymorpha]